MSDFSKTKTVHILGGGVAGLSCAFFIKQNNPQVKTVLYESSSHLGGRAYSFFDPKWNMMLDNAVHAVLGANKDVCRFLPNLKFEKVSFYDADKQEVSQKYWRFLPEIKVSVFNTPNPAPRAQWMVLKSLFPFVGKSLKVWFSEHNLTETLLKPLQSYVDELHLKNTLKGFKAQDGRIKTLEFDKKKVEIGEDDFVISALDARNYHKIFGGETFSFNRIINIYFHTSTKLWLPNGKTNLGIKNLQSHWLSAGENILAVTISNYDKKIKDRDAFARQIWHEVSQIRNFDAAFLPDYKILDYPYATIAQDNENNQKRPQSSRTKYQNLHLAGDWTLKDYPCCLNGAIISAQRVAKNLF